MIGIPAKQRLLFSLLRIKSNKGAIRILYLDVNLCKRQITEMSCIFGSEIYLCFTVRFFISDSSTERMMHSGLLKCNTFL